jgi:hypothetical protein
MLSNHDCTSASSNKQQANNRPRQGMMVVDTSSSPAAETLGSPLTTTSNLSMLDVAEPVRADSIRYLMRVVRVSGGEALLTFWQGRTLKNIIEYAAQSKGGTGIGRSDEASLPNSATAPSCCDKGPAETMIQVSICLQKVAFRSS